jgi:hypothetical protein
MIIGISEKGMKRLGMKVVSLIKENTLAGFDKDGLAFKSYSTRPFAMPSGATTKRALGKLDKDGGLVWFKKDGKAIWVVVLGGYLALKKARYPKGRGVPNLTATGAMMRSLGVLRVSDNKITIGFKRAEEAEKMLWNINKGRDPLGLPEDQWDEVVDKLNDKDIEIVF